jgi:D-amino-acid dehydrogenase
MRLPIYPAKGYSVTMPVKDASMAHQVSADGRRVQAGVLAPGRTADRLRIAGTAELNGYDRDLNRVRCEAIVRRVEQLFPGAGDATRPVLDRLRPATPSNVPIIGRSKLPNLFLNTGHGTLGWTHACGSGKHRPHRQRLRRRWTLLLQACVHLKHFSLVFPNPLKGDSR